MKEPVISIIMPAYNVEKYIEKSINSVIVQTFCEWELIIIDDCSTDLTYPLLEKYTDPRIVKVKRTTNSGSAYLPREEGVRISRGEWIVNLDADDYIAETYLENLYKEATFQKVDICTAQMIVVDFKEKVTGYKIPNDEYEFNIVKSNTEAFNLTVPYWFIGMNGALIKRSLWMKALDYYSKKERYEIHDDENLSRLLLLYTNGFIAIREKYFFRSNPSSVTSIFSLKTFKWRNSNLELKNIVKKFFGNNSNEYRNTEYYDFLCYKTVLSEFLRNADSKIFDEGITLLKDWHKNIKWEYIIPRCNGIKQKIFKNFNLSLLLVMIKHSRFLFLEYLTTASWFRIFNTIKMNKYYAWFITRKINENKIRSRLESYYTDSNLENVYSFVACIYDGATESGGLADRLKGIIGVYYLAKRKNIPFRLYFKHPFPLEEYLIPNTYDWRVSKNDLCLNPKLVNIVVLDNTQDSTYQIKKQKEYLSKYILNSKKQIHVYTNASFAYDLNYGQLFRELFKPSKNLQNALIREKKLISTKYISVSCRFLNLLGDFNETYGYKKPLDNMEKKVLLDKIEKVILELHLKYPNMKILVNSDSVTFLKKYTNVEFTHVIKGNITHIDAENKEYYYLKYEKTFLDFMMIAGAEYIYLIKSSKMHNSGYPFAASKIYGKPFELIEI